MYPRVDTCDWVCLLTFPVLICVLESLDQPQSLIHRASHGQVIDGDLAKDTLAIDDKEAPVGDPLIFLQHAVITGQLSGYISQQGDVQRAQASLLPGSVDPEGGGEKVGTSEWLVQQGPYPVIRAWV